MESNRLSNNNTPVNNSNKPHRAENTLNLNELDIINNLNPDRIYTILTDEEEFEKFFQNLEPVISQKVVVQELKEGNESLAKKNIAKRDSINNLLSEVRQEREKLSSYEHKFEEDFQVQNKIMKSKFQTKPLLTELQSEKAYTDLESERICEKFLKKEINSSDFISQFIDTRKQYYVNSLKLSKFDDNLPVYHNE
ncbi:hypothetical protein CONCODRAFT_14311 [Conidiobolus coronatus NRRL 28638]|uniref:VPS37 C-terminal domain-containing protein n=1 Tax=Conidiobolus coronatus (strain ATCC 28846 / CBS 209.66 / NRRL 28638) TaxID=796925 RepID=A0A137NP83_CONC2|nr:hypothetical protein CONCODRAFT_14311 [Conidiobolus coronatus NRRL 28638]|eukprot:KXN64550.1 hypothetical protein CONCODRAFT_14311 [Conidiobolus coronatus NRRL 28638]